MKIAVTGGAGFIGSHLVSYLCDKGHEVVVIDIDVFPPWLDARAKYLKANICYLASETFLDLGIEAVFHLAAVSRVVSSFKFPAVTYETNVIGTLRVARACRKARCPLVYAGSCTARNPQKTDDVSDSPYAQSKRMGEEIVLAEYLGLDARVVRFFNVYGKILSGLESPLDSVVSVFARKVSRRENIEVVGDGEQFRDFIHVSDVVEALYNSLSDFSKVIFEVGTGVATSVRSLAQDLAADRVGIVYGSKREGERVGYTAIPALYPGGARPRIQLHDYIARFHATGEL